MEFQIEAKSVKLFLRSRLRNNNYIFKPLLNYPDSNYSKLKFIISSSIKEYCNNSVLLLGPRGTGKIAVLELVLRDIFHEYPEMVSVVRLSGILHSEDNCALKEIASQLCAEHQLGYSKMASFDDNSQFMVAMLRECGQAHKTIIFTLDEFDLFAQGKQRFLYTLLDAMKLVASQAVVIAVSSRLGADHLLEKRVRSRFSHRKLMFHPLSKEDALRLLEHALSLPLDLSFSDEYAAQYNYRLSNILSDERFKEILSTHLHFNSTIGHLLRFLYIAVSYMDLKSGLLSVENFKTALLSIQLQPKHESLKDCSILELYLLACMKRLEIKEQSSYTFTSVMKEYKSIQGLFQIHDYHAQNTCYKAFEHLLQCDFICFLENKCNNQLVEFHPVKLLISHAQLLEGFKSYRSCPVNLLKLIDH